MQDLAQQIQDLTKDLCRNLKENPSVTENLGKTQQHRSDYMNMIELALNEFKQKQSYYQLENDVSQQYNIFQEHKNLAAKEKRAREQVEALLEQIQKDKEQHQQFLKENNQALAQLKENLFYEKQRITQCLDLLETELSAADGEMIRLRKEETQKQLDRLNSLQEQIDA